MNSLLGLLDTLEAVVAAGQRIPLSSKIIVDEKYIYKLLDKCRYLIQKESQKKSASVTSREEPVTLNESVDQTEYVQAQNVLNKAYRNAEVVERGVNEYAQEVMSNLQLMVTKMQKDLMRVEKNIESGRDLLDKKIQKTEVKDDMTDEA